MRVIVSGATGFLGTHLVRRLLSDGIGVVALGRDIEKGRILEEIGAAFVPSDLERPESCPRVPDADAFVHAAALSSNWGATRAFVSANVEGTRTAIKLARDAGVKRFVHISSPSIYFRFEDQLSVAEDVPLPPPVNAYAASKRAAETIVLAAPDIKPVILRPRGIYGAGDSSLLPRLTRAARRGPLPLMRSGRAATDITHVDDVVSAVLATLNAPDSLASHAFNISGGVPLPIMDIVEKACASEGVSVRWREMPAGLALALAGMAEAACALLPHRPEPVATRYSLGIFAFSQTLDISRAKRLLNWTPAVSFEEGLGRL
ncbi:MAG: NAD(P)-dependent oxidoreductase [Hyphomicrobiaceae bacterium]|nr:NAD(P)-dependent oxidoreductase [Hyphomicrobiaceae bacterium]